MVLSMPVPPRIKLSLSNLKFETIHKSGCYIVPILWMSTKQLLLVTRSIKTQLEKRLSKNPELLEQYADSIREDNRKGYVVTVEPDGSR